MSTNIYQLLQSDHTVRTVLAGTVIGCALLFLLMFLLLIRVAMLSRRIKSLTRGVNRGNLEETLIEHLRNVGLVEVRMDAIEQAVGVLQAQVPQCINKVHLIRYNAFPDVGGEQSFSLVMLDSKRNGMILSCVASRAEVRVYGKEIRNGAAGHPLSADERRALKESSLQ